MKARDQGQRWAAACGAVVLAAAAWAPQTAQASYTAVYAFGDSLTDTGNLLAATTLAYGPAGALPQTSDYWNGRFSSGPVAVEVLSTRLGLPLIDFAFGGATTGLGPTYPTGPGTSFSTGLEAQLDLFDATFGGLADPNGLYFIWAGSNDLRDAFTTLDPLVLANTASTVINNLLAAVQHLYAEGARNFFLPTLPDFGLTPEGQASGAAATLSGFSTQFDGMLTGAYQMLEAALPGASLDVFDTLSLQRAVTADPAAYGISDVTTPCFSGYVGIAGPQCAAGFDTTAMYWDKVHPTAATHYALGKAMANQVPEPGAMLLSALAVAACIAASSRRRVRGQAAAQRAGLQAV